MSDLAERIERTRAALISAKKREGVELFDGQGSLLTMLDPIELRLLYLLARDVVEGWGDVAELGSFLGGSTRALGAGLRDGAARREQAPGEGAPGERAARARLHTYDRFVQSAWPGYGIVEGEDVLPRWEEQVAPVRDLVDLHVGMLENGSAGDGTWELVFVDIVKQASAIQPVVADFVARTRPGSVLVHQDMFHWGSPWVLSTIAACWDRMAWIGPAARSTGVFVVTEDLSDLATDLDWSAMSVSAHLSLIDELAERIEHPTLHVAVQLAGLYLARTVDPGLFERRLAEVRPQVRGPRLERYLAEVCETVPGVGALAAAEHPDPADHPDDHTTGHTGDQPDDRPHDPPGEGVEQDPPPDPRDHPPAS